MILSVSCITVKILEESDGVLSMSGKKVTLDFGLKEHPDSRSRLQLYLLKSGDNSDTWQFLNERSSKTHSWMTQYFGR